MRTIGVLAAWQVYEGATIDGYLHTLLDGIRAAARDRTCNLLLACGVAPPVPRRLLTPAWPVPMPDSQFVPVGPWNTDSLVVVPNRLSEERLSYVQTLIADGHPVVFAGAPELRPTVAVDNAGGIDQAVDHLIMHGRRRIAFIAGPIAQPGDSLERLQAYQAALHRLDLDVDPLLIAYGDQADDIESGRQAMQRILAAGVPFSGLLTFNDWFAIGAMEALKSAELDIPGDVAVIAALMIEFMPAFRRHPSPLCATPPLTLDISRSLLCWICWMGPGMAAHLSASRRGWSFASRAGAALESY